MIQARRALSTYGLACFESKPRFLLPDGCKDLIDVIRLQEAGKEQEESVVTLPDPVVLSDLAKALHLESSQVVASLLNLNTHFKGSPTI